MPTTMRRTTVRLPHHFYDLVEAEASASGLSVAALYREAIMSRVIWGQATRGESVYAVAHQVALAARNIWSAVDRAPGEPAAAARAIYSIREHAPDSLDEILRALDERDPEVASYLRELYLVPPGGFAADAMRLAPPAR
jgi:hypothetical protein